MFICLSLTFYMLLIESFWIRTTKVTIETKKWPYEKPLKIVVLSDFHIIWPWMTKNRVRKIIKKTNKLNPDVVFLLGDYSGKHMFGMQINPYKTVTAFEALKAKCGVYAVIGNHDLASQNNWTDAMEQLSIPLLRNKAVEIECDENRFWVAGIDDLEKGKPNLAKTLMPISPDNPVFLLCHNPDIFPEVPKSVAATFSGHTHAGQIRLPFFGALAKVVPSKYGKRYVYGHIKEDGKDLFVTAGLGNTGLPLRFMNRSEIALITITR